VCVKVCVHIRASVSTTNFLFPTPSLFVNYPDSLSLCFYAYIFPAERRALIKTCDSPISGKFPLDDMTEDPAYQELNEKILGAGLNGYSFLIENYRTITQIDCLLFTHVFVYLFFSKVYVFDFLL